MSRPRRGAAAEVVPVPATVKALVGSRRVFRLGDFIAAVAPNLEFNLQENPSLGQHNDVLFKRLADTLVSPINQDTGSGLRPISSKKKESNQVSLSALVDDVIWSLVNNRHSAGRNALSQGYVIASESLQHKVTTCGNMRAGVMCTRLNGNVAFCKSSKLFRVLHLMLGDDIMRFLLLRTSVFVPLAEEEPQRGSASERSNRQHTYLSLIHI